MYVQHTVQEHWLLLGLRMLLVALPTGGGRPVAPRPPLPPEQMLKHLGMAGPADLTRLILENANRAKYIVYV